MSAANFDNCLAITLRYEGGYADHPADPGGATNLGITHKTLAAWRGKPVSKADVKALKLPEAAAIYRAQYWDAVRGDALPDGVDLVVFDYAVNSGPGRAVKALQKVVGTEPDAIIGAMTLDATRKALPKEVVAGVCAERLAFVRGLSTFATFGKGWTSRINNVHAKALSMVSRFKPVDTTGAPKADEKALPPPVVLPPPPAVPAPHSEPVGKADEKDTTLASREGFWTKIAVGAGTVATALTPFIDVLKDWKVIGVVGALGIVGYLVYSIVTARVAK